MVLLCVKYGGGRLAPHTPKPAVAGAPLLLAFANAQASKSEEQGVYSLFDLERLQGL